MPSPGGGTPAPILLPRPARTGCRCPEAPREHGACSGLRKAGAACPCPPILRWKGEESA